MERRYVVMFFFLLALAITGCSSASNSPVIPDRVDMIGSEDGSHSSWGIWQFIADPDAGTLDVVSLRNASLHLNALPFLEPPPMSNLTVQNIQFFGNVLSVDVALRHPFLGLNQYTGFDVCGIFITPGTLTGFEDSSIVIPGPGDTRLVNPDGFTRWWNPAEFPVNQGTIQSYNDGLLGDAYADDNFNCTLNAYKYFADGLDPYHPLYTLDPAERGVFSAGQQNMRAYLIELNGELVFNYAVDANWKLPSGEPPFDVPDDFPAGANRPEAWNITVTETENTLWNDGVSSGGNLRMVLNIYDHFSAELNSVLVESPGNFTSAASPTPVGGGPGFSTYEVEILSATPAPESIDLLITVECEKSGYGGHLPGKQQAAYFMYRAEVTDVGQTEGIFVDGDNASDPDQDGTTAHPFDDVFKAILAAGSPPYEDVYDIYVDPFDDGTTMYSYFKFYNLARVHGTSWNGGPGKPLINWNSQAGLVSSVDDCLVEGFDYIIDLPVNTDIANVIQISNADNFTIRDCKFTGYARGRTTRIFQIRDSVGLTIEDNEFVGLRNKYDELGPDPEPGQDPHWDGHTLYIIDLQNCQNYLLRHNEFHDFGYSDEGPSTTWAWTITYMVRTVACGGSSFTNNLIYDFNDFSKADPTGDPMEYTKNHAHLVYWGSTPEDENHNFTFANNTFDDLSVTGGDSSVNAQGSATYGSRPHSSWVMKNNICSNWHDLTTVAQVNWHRGFWSDGPGDQVDMDYSACFNYGTPGAGVTVGGFVNYINQGIGCFELADNQDPAYDMTPGSNFYHVTNPVLLSDDGSEMGAFGGPDGGWLPPSQE